MTHTFHHSRASLAQEYSGSLSKSSTIASKKALMSKSPSLWAQTSLLLIANLAWMSMSNYQQAENMKSNLHGGVGNASRCYFGQTMF